MASGLLGSEFGASRELVAGGAGTMVPALPQAAHGQVEEVGIQPEVRARAGGTWVHPITGLPRDQGL